MLRLISGLLLLTASLVTAAQNKTSDLTMIPALQNLGAKLLEGKQGSIVAIKPSTGEVLCLVSNSTSKSYINRALTGIYAPGSTFKVAQALVMHSEHIVDKEARFDCDQGFYMGKVHIGCHKHAAALNMVNAIGQSCNTWFCQSFMAMIGDTEQYGSRRQAMNVWSDYMQSMGFGHTLGIDMKNEAGGLIPNGQWMNSRYGDTWDESKVMYMGMGQGQLLVTPLQLCNFSATVANRGYYFTPYTHKSSARRYPEKYATRHRTKASREAYDQVTDGMRVAVERGTAKNIGSRQYVICGKTGTVENKGADHSVFIGFAPMQKPQIAVCVYVENAGFGADVAAPMAARIIRTYMGK